MEDQTLRPALSNAQLDCFFKKKHLESPTTTRLASSRTSHSTARTSSLPPSSFHQIFSELSQKNAILLDLKLAQLSQALEELLRLASAVSATPGVSAVCRAASGLTELVAEARRFSATELQMIRTVQSALLSPPELRSRASRAEPLLEVSKAKPHLELSEAESRIELLKTEHPRYADEAIDRLLNKEVYKRFPLSETEWRVNLPVEGEVEAKFNVLKVLKENLGKDLSRISMPACLNEPLSGTQKSVEFLEYASSLDMASKSSERLLRPAFIIAFFMLNYSKLTQRIRKSFNPLLGETFELETPEFRAFSEQISHHPPVTAFNLDSPRWQIDGNSLPLVNFSLASGISVQVNGPYSVTLKTTGEIFDVTRPKGTLHNVFFGKKYAWMTAEIVVVNRSTRDIASLSFLPKNKDPSKNFQVKGTVKTSDGKIGYHLSGKWNGSLFATREGGGDPISLGSVIPISEDSAKEYYFSEFSKNLNHLSKSATQKLPRTDSRFRPDMRALEFGDMEFCEREKTRIEEAQRTRIKINPKFKPVWFDCEEKDGVLHSKFNNKYWQYKSEGIWPNDLPNLYD